MCVRCNGRWACVTVSLVDFQVLRSAVPENRHLYMHLTLPVYEISPVKHIGFQWQLDHKQNIILESLTVLCIYGIVEICLPRFRLYHGRRNLKTPTP
jgi:hypothetical protein